MLKRDDRVWDRLLEDIESLVSSRYIAEADAFVSNGSKDGVRFSSLSRQGQFELIMDHIEWNRYEDKGIAEVPALTIVGNVLDGKPKAQWLEGVFDRDVGKITLRDILRSDPTNKHQEVKTQERGGREM